MGTIVLIIKNIESATTINADYQTIQFFMAPISITVFGALAAAISPVIGTIYDKRGSITRLQEDAWRLATTCEENRQTAPP